MNMQELQLPFHGNPESEMAVSPPRSPRYFVQSPAHSLLQDVEKMSYASSPFASPTHHLFQSQEQDSSTSRFSSSMKNSRTTGWRRYFDAGGREEDEDDEGGQQVKVYMVCFLLSFLLLFALFSFILWASSFAYKPRITVTSICFENLNVQAGMDATGVPTDMLSLNSTVVMAYANPATFFGVHVDSAPLHLRYFDLEIASAQMGKFYQPRRTQRRLAVVVQGRQVPLYGGLGSGRSKTALMAVPLNLTVLVTSRAYILGKLVKSNFYSNVLCQVTLREKHLGVPLNLTRSSSCMYL